MRRTWGVCILDQLLKQECLVEHIYSHGGQRHIFLAWDVLGTVRLLFKLQHPGIFIYTHDTKGFGGLKIHLNTTHGHIGTGGYMVGDHGAVIHTINMVTRQDQDIIWVMLAENIYILVYRIGRSSIPAVLNPLLGRQQLHIFTEFTT